MRTIYSYFSALVLVLLVTGCTAGTTPQVIENTIPVPATATRQVVSKNPSADCPVTTSGSSTFQAPEPWDPIAPWQGLFWYGSANLWTALYNDGIWSDLPLNPDGYTQKIMWWSDKFSLPDEQQPALTVSGRRLDADAPPLRFYGATNATADDIGSAMLTGVDFPTLGCWEVRGEYKKTELVFVVWVRE